MRWFLLLLLLPSVALAHPRHKNSDEKRDVFVLVDGSSPAWDGVVATAVGQFNALHISGMPKIRYRRGAAAACPEYRISVCALRPDSPYGGITYARKHRARVMLTDFPSTPEWKANAACHELMHVLVPDLPDNYGARPDTSCLWGSLGAPGSWDIKKLRHRYG